jgi:RNA polymerase sigma factor (sigma-70 family)
MDDHAGAQSDSRMNRIRVYSKPLWGYALNRTKNRQDAEDLLQDIMVQLLRSLPAREEIRNLDAYVWSIAKYTWANWSKKRMNAPQTIALNGMQEHDLDDRFESKSDLPPLQRIIEAETLRTLRREVAFLSETHRRIVIMHYYDGRKQADIARRLGLPVGTVKWHLHDARLELRKGMKRMHENATLGMNPIRLVGTGHAGSPGQKGETGDFLGRPLAQNIVYAAYHKPLTVKEIAAKLDVPPTLLESEVLHLAEYAFLSETLPGRYQSNTIVWDLDDQQSNDSHRLYEACSARIADAFFTSIIQARETIERSGIYYPERDFNFLLWTLLPMELERQSDRLAPASPARDAVVPYRPDGGRYIALASVDRSDRERRLSFDPRPYWTNGPMTRAQDGQSTYAWRMATYWSDFQHWNDFHYRDAELYRQFMTGRLPETDAEQEAYAFLLERGYIMPGDGGYYGGAVWIDSPATLDRLHAAIPDAGTLLEQPLTALFQGLLEVALRRQPKHLHRQIELMVRFNAYGGRLTAYVLKQLVAEGKLAPPQPHQRKTITTWFGAVR